MVFTDASKHLARVDPASFSPTDSDLLGYVMNDVMVCSQNQACAYAALRQFLPKHKVTFQQFSAAFRTFHTTKAKLHKVALHTHAFRSKTTLIFLHVNEPHQDYSAAFAATLEWLKIKTVYFAYYSNETICATAIGRNITLVTCEEKAMSTHPVRRPISPSKQSRAPSPAGSPEPDQEADQEVETHMSPPVSPAISQSSTTPTCGCTLSTSLSRSAVASELGTTAEKMLTLWFKYELALHHQQCIPSQESDEAVRYASDKLTSFVSRHSPTGRKLDHLLDLPNQNAPHLVVNNQPTKSSYDRFN